MQQSLDLAKKLLIILCGLAFLALGILGILIPVLPGFIFLIISAACFASISETARLKFRDGYHRYRQRHVPGQSDGLNILEKVQLKALQSIAAVFKWLN